MNLCTTMLLIILTLFLLQDCLFGLVFPGEWETIKQEEEARKAAAEAAATGCVNMNITEPWCDDPADYPDTAITDLITGQDKSIISNFFDLGLVPFTRPGEDPLSVNEENICDTVSRYIIPRAAKNKASKFMFIVNHPEGSEDYLQLVKVTTCQAAEEECAQGQLLGYISTRCKQEYSDHKLVALSETGKELVVDTFSFPSCCSCVFSNQLELRTAD